MWKLGSWFDVVDYRLTFASAVLSTPITYIPANLSDM